MEAGGVNSVHIAATSGAAFAAGGRGPAPRPFERIVVFGDSLSDSGNGGRFSNGPVWVERLARYFGVALLPAARGGTNFAVGGALIDGPPGSQSLGEQLRLYLERYRREDAAADAARTLHVLFGGANDIFAAMYEPAPGTAVIQAAGTMARIVADLIAQAGARHVFVVNLPDIGATPAVRAAGPEAMRAVRMLSIAYNTALERALRAAEADASAPVAIRCLDLFALSERVFAEPQRFGFRNVTEPCLDRREDPTGCLFWDEIHPTTAAHAKLAEAAIAALLPPSPVPPQRGAGH
jgi:outer membrane lipase/esterase